MTLDEQKELIAKQVCLYSADLLELRDIKTEEILSAMKFLNMSIEFASRKEDLVKIKDNLKEFYPSLPVFESGI